MAHLPRGRCLAAWVFVVVLGPRLCGAAPATELDDLQAECDAITECACIRGTSCGWCVSRGKAMPLPRTAPSDAWCPKWHAKATSCDFLHCASKDGGTSAVLRWIVDCGWFPLLCGLLSLSAYFKRQAIETTNKPRVATVEAWARSISFATGQAVVRIGSLGREPPTSAILSEPARGGSGVSPAGTFSREISCETAATFAEASAPQFFSMRRTFENFAKGVTASEFERLPLEPDRPYELNLSELSVRPGESVEKYLVGRHRFAVTLRIALQWRTALGATMCSSLGLMFLSSLVILFMRNAARYWHKDDYEYLSLIAKEWVAVVGSFRTAATGILSFYALQRIQWYWDVLMQGHELQGRAHDLALIAGANAARATNEDWRARYMLYRLLMLCFFFAYQAYTPKLRFLGYVPLVNSGLLTRKEAEALKLSHCGPLTVCESWLSQWVEAHLSQEARQQAYMALREYRASMQHIGDLISNRAPMSFESLMYIAVYALCASLPFTPSHVDVENRDAVMQSTHVASSVSVALFSSFYLALVHILRHLQAPFDDVNNPNDALNPLALMNTTERHLRDYLTAPPPGAGWHVPPAGLNR